METKSANQPESRVKISDYEARTTAREQIISAFIALVVFGAMVFFLLQYFCNF